MSDKICLSINNLGLINNAELDIGKINVIIGKNSTGKSTSSKFLYCLLTASSKDGLYLANRDIKKRYTDFVLYWSSQLSNDSLSFTMNDIYIKLSNDSLSNQLFDEVYMELKDVAESFDDKKSYLKGLESIYELVNINKNSKIRHVSIFNSLLNSEYGDSLRDTDDTHVKFYGDIDGEVFNQDIQITNQGKNWKVSNEYLTYFNFSNIIYIDSPSVLDFGNEINRNNQIHFQLLSKKLKKNIKDVYDNEAYKKIISFKRKVDDLIGGKFTYNHNSRKFFFEKNDIIFPMESTASGLKQLGIFQMLLENNELCEDSFLIMDEPEVNLHPEFQVKFAEILVLACKELNMMIYINTHSPFLAEAIEVYSKYYGLYGDTNFYLTEYSDTFGKYNYNLIDDLDIMKVYMNLGNPFEILNDIRFRLELNDGD